MAGSDGPLGISPLLPGPATGWADQPTEFYHGTSVASALKIQQDGFDVDLSGRNRGAQLGQGVYMSTTLAKAMEYAADKPHGGVILKLLVALGRCRVIGSDDPERRTWSQRGYDSAWAPPGVLSRRSHGENCVYDPTRIEVVGVIAGETRKLQVAGFRTVRSGDRVVLVSAPMSPRNGHKHGDGAPRPDDGADTGERPWGKSYQMAAAAVQQLATYSWFLGTLTRYDAARRLEPRTIGTFLVRLGTALPVISVRYIRPDGRDALFNVQISQQLVAEASPATNRVRQQPRQITVGMPALYRYGVCPSTMFPDIPALIEYYMKYPSAFFASLADAGPYRGEQLQPFVDTTVLRERQAPIGGYGSI